jgi:putative aminopeptidase FrvX
MKILTELCSAPTAPFAEQRVIEYVEKFARTRPKLKFSRDQFDNLLLELPGRTKSPRLVFVAHMDHPGFVAKRMLDDRTLLADFRGGVLSEYVNGAKVIFFDNDREIPGTVISTAPLKSAYPTTATIRLRFRVSPGIPGMFDQGAPRIKNNKFYNRACDDLAGAASALTMLDELLKKPTKNSVAVLLTRAEEDGFVGAIASVLYPKLLRKSDRIISIECSAMQPAARQGDGVVLRVGDRTSIFNSAFMYFLHQQAELLKKRDKKFKYQRSLMPGGTCEATVFDLYGYVTGAICVPLGNYHNMDREKKKIGPEYVDLNDWKNMVKLFVQIANHLHEFDPKFEPLRRRIEARFKKQKSLL